MSDPRELVERLEALSDAKRALLRRALESRGRDASAPASEPIAIVGLGCRFPGGASSPLEFWKMLERGAAGVRAVPAERWDVDAYYDPDPDAAGKMSTRWGGFLDDVAGFDARFFGISPREAARADPQQRLLLEVAWEALEDAGQAPDRLRDFPVGVFVGISTNDYSQIQIKGGDAHAIDAYFGTGNALSMAAGRLSYVLGLQGPSLSVDTACSSSLVAVHLACQSLQTRESDLALAGGVNVMLLPEITVNFSKAHMMAADGRCKSFDAAADGYVRGEGCGVIVLKRLADALAAGDDVRAVIRGAAVNHDGRSAGLTVPNGAAQASLIRRALQRAGVRPADVQYIEAHGSGTSLGDPIELRVLAEIFQTDRAGGPLAVGSVKTNIGHLEAAAGIAGLIKVVLAFRYGLIPPHLHFRTINPHVSDGARTIAIPVQPTPWPSTRTHLAGVSSFGFSGTNAHVILESAPAPPASGVRRPFDILVLSAPTSSALETLSTAWACRLAELDDDAWPDACQTSTVGRAHFAHRLAVVAPDAREAARALADEPSARGALARGTRRTAAPRLAFLFTGQGAVYLGMGRALYENQPVFRAAMDRCDAWLRERANLPLLDRIYGPAATEGALTATSCGQPAIFAFQHALVEMWRSWGVAPDVVIGHSVGEIAAAWTAGVLELEEALGFAAERGRLLNALPPGGAMVTAQIALDDAIGLLNDVGGGAVIAAVNAPNVVTLSGSADAIGLVMRAMRERKIPAKRLDVSHAFHSPLLDPALDAVEASARRLANRPPRIRWISTLTGAAFEAGRGPDAAYWRRQLREPVLFDKAVQALAAIDCAVALEIGPTAVLSNFARRAWRTREAAMPPSLVRGQNDWQAVLKALAELYVSGVDVQWAATARGFERRVRPMPTYPFERQPYWIDNARADRPASAARREAPERPHPLLGSRVDRPALATTPAHDRVEFESVLQIDTVRELRGHQVNGAVVMPAAGFVEMALAAAGPALGRGSARELTLSIDHPLTLLPGESRRVQTSAERAGSDGVRIEVQSGSPAAPEGRTTHATGHVRSPDSLPIRIQANLAELRARCPEPIAATDFYAAMRQRGFEYGPPFNSVTELSAGDREALARVDPAIGPADAGLCVVHPALLDGCIQVAAAALPAAWRRPDQHEPAFPIAIERLFLRGSPPARLWSHARLRQGETPHRAEIDLDLYDDEGVLVGEVRGLLLARVDDVRRGASTAACYEIAWRRRDLQATAPRPGAVLVLAGDRQRATRLARGIEAAGSAVALTPFDPLRADTTWREELATREWTTIVYVPSAGSIESTGDEVASICEGLRDIVCALPAGARAPRLVAVTRGAHIVGAGDGQLAPAHTALWGFTRCLALERPDLNALLVDLDDEEVAKPAALVAGDIDEDEMAFRRGETFVPRLVRSSATPNRPAPLSGDATYLITGGRGALGFEVAKHLSAHGARHLVLLGRTPLAGDTPGSGASRHADLEAMTGRGVRVMNAAGDVTRFDDLAALRERLRAEGWPEVRGIIHAAGVLADRTVEQLDGDSLRRVVFPKVDGLRQLERAFADTPLDFLAAFSSAAAALGSAGQAAYAAANAAIDGWALARSRQGRRAISLAWSGWRGMGMAGHLPPSVPALDSESALDAFNRLVASDAGHVIVIPAGMRPDAFAGRRSLLADLRPAESGAAAAASAAALRDRVRATAEPMRRHLVLGYVRDKCAAALGLDRAALDVAQPLTELGLDSLMAMEVRTRLMDDLQVTLPVARLLDGPTVERVASEVMARLDIADADGGAAEPCATALSQSEFPLSRGQMAMWFLQQLAPESTAYHLGDAVVVRGPLDVPALGRAFETMTARHPALRTTLVIQEGQEGSVRQRVHPRPPVSGFEHRESPGWGAVQCVEQLRDEMERPFNLERGPLTRLVVLSRRPDEHYLLLSMHHIVGELWALILLVQELSALYKADTGKSVAALPVPVGSYADFVAREQRLLDGAEGVRLTGYWVGKLTPLPMPLTLPMARPRPPVQTYRGALHAFRIGRATGEALKQVSRQESTTLFTALLAALMVLLRRLSGQTDLVVGSPMTGRTRPEWSDVIGYFDNPVPLRADLAGSPSFRDVVRRVRATVLEAFEHQACPFPLIVERVQPPRDPGRSPLFDVMFVLRKSPVSDLQRLTRFAMGQAGALLDLGDGLSAESLDWNRRISQLDLTLAVTEEGGEYFSSWEYNADLFDAASIDALTGHFLVLLEAAVERPDEPIDSLAMTTGPERQRALVEWNATDAPFPADWLLHQGFEERAHENPDAVAVIADGRRMTYGDLNREAIAAAEWLRPRIATPGQPVAVVMDKGWEQLVAVLAILKAGAAYVPIDARLPPERVRHLVDRCDVRCALTQPGSGARVPKAMDVLELRAGAAPIGPIATAAPAAQPEDLAYIIFTSGSTGQPKGVMIDHRAAWNTVYDVNRRFDVGPTDRALALSSLGFDLSVYDIFGLLAAGGALVIPRAADAQDPAHWTELVRRHEVSIWNTVPTLFQLFVQYLDTGREPSRSSLRLALLSGDWIPITLPGRARTHFDGIEIVSLGGATEAAIWSILYPIGDVDPSWKSIPYGRPMANQKVFVLDRALEPCPVGLAGDLYIGGVGLARGYWKDEERTSAAFFLHPRTGERLYRTGDLGRYVPDGTIEFLGRADAQVKIRGFRVEPAEVESVLARLPGVSRAVVTAREDEPGGKRLVAYVVCDRELPAGADALRRALAERLPDYMVPSRFVFLDSLPLGPNGKVNVRALPVPDSPRGAADATGELPRNALEEQLTALWRDVLRVARIGIRDDFFALGGDSVQSIQISVRALEAGLHVSPREIFEYPTIAGLAEHLSRRADVDQRQIPESALNDRRAFPLAPLSEKQIEAVLARFGGAAAAAPDGSPSSRQE